MSKDQLPDLLRQMVCRNNDELDIFWKAADEIERLRGRLAEVERAAGVACNGCGHTETIEQIRAKHPNAISCCPERDMVPAVTWMKRADTATARAERLEAALTSLLSNLTAGDFLSLSRSPHMMDSIRDARGALSDSPHKGARDE